MKYNNSIKSLVLSTLFATLPSGFISAQILPYQNPALSAEERAEDLCSRLELSEKIQLMMDRSPAIERLGVPQFEWWNEALHGVGRNGFATVFPITMNMAASFDDALVYKVFSAVSDEARAKNTEARLSNEMKRYRGLSFWTPNINIFRDPRWGRGQETYGEDPYLTTKMGLAVTRGLQGYSYDGKKPTSKYAKLFACAKHYAVHSGPEWNRHSFNIENLPERDLWETYLPAFKALVQEGDVKEVMCAYQRIDGEPCCAQTRYLHQILRDEWGFKGIVTSDCGAIRDFWSPGNHGFSPDRADASAKAVIAGTDVECGSEYKSLPEAIKAGLISEEQINVSLKRLLKARFELGDFDSDELVEWTKIPMSVVANKEHKQLALEIAREGMTLLQNNNHILPLKPDQKIVVMGPNANDSTMQWGNYTGTPTSTITILQGIQNKSKNVQYIQGCGLTRNEVFESLFNDLQTPDGEKGVKATYWNNENFEDTPVATVVNTSRIRLDNGGNTAFTSGVNLEHFSARYETVLCPKEDAEIILNLAGEDYLDIIFDGDTLFSKWNGHGVVYKTFAKKVEAGKQYKIQMDYIQQIGLALFGFDVTKKVNTTFEQIIEQADDADVVVFVGGISPRLEGEEMKVNEEGFKGGDRISIELPAVQREMIARLKQAGKKVVFVNCSGGAMGLVSESQHADAILQAWYCGEQGGQAVADVLFGDYNPSGKLPVTFYKNAQQLPDFEDYRMAGRTYRYFKGDALFPFGYGLSYTTFEIGKPIFMKNKLLVKVKNTGQNDGSEVVQVYVRNPRDLNGPLKTLRCYKRIHLKAGEQTTLSIDVPNNSFELWDSRSNTMRVVPGKYELMVGNSSRDADLKKITIRIK